MHRVALIGLLLLAACADRPGSSTYRQSDSPIWSSAAFVPGQMVGTWQQVAAFSTEAAGCAAAGVSFQPEDGVLRARGSLCLDGKVTDIDSAVAASGPGRLSLSGFEDWWILWVDEGYRTLAIGTPSGRFGFVLDRGAGAADRLAAAREVFDFNGYDLRYLRQP